MKIVIGSRGSKLALWQAEWVKARLAVVAPDADIRIEILKTSGDVMRDVPLSVIGGQGAFTKELELALIDGRIDLAVHSLKDLPTVIPRELELSAITEREDPRDALVLPEHSEHHVTSLADLPTGSIVGTSSPRRLAQLRYARGDIKVKDLRGNVDTRLRKLDAGEYDAVILAAAGLRRLGFDDRISAFLRIEEMLPAIGQGALGLETRAGDKAIELVGKLNDSATRAACEAERSLLRGLGGGCLLPIAAHASVDGATLTLDGLVAATDGSNLVRDRVSGAPVEAEHLGKQLALKLKSSGALELLG